MSATGGRLVVGSRESFCVIDLGSRTVAYEGAGRFPRISPSGEALAFVDSKQALWLAALAGGRPKRCMRGWAVPGVGAWSQMEDSSWPGLGRMDQADSSDVTTGRPWPWLAQTHNPPPGLINS
jgi:hypothetical protein